MPPMVGTLRDILVGVPEAEAEAGVTIDEAGTAVDVVPGTGLGAEAGRTTGTGVAGGGGPGGRTGVVDILGSEEA